MKRYTHEDFVNLVSKKYPGAEVLSQYTDSKTKIKIKCPKGHTSLITPSNILFGGQCGECYGHKKLSHNVVKAVIEKMHPGAILLSEKYKNNSTKLKVKCEKGHIFYANYNNIKDNNRWCPFCSGRLGVTIETMKKYIEKTHPDAVLLSKKYVNSKTKLKIQCEKGHIFYSSRNFLTRGSWCGECCKSKKLTLRHVKQEIEKTGATLLQKTYKNAATTMQLECRNKHIWEINYNNFQRGRGCPICSNNGMSKKEQEVASYLKSILPDAKMLTNDREVLQGKELDIYFPDKKIAVEYCGLYWHSEYYKEKNYHFDKYRACQDKGVRLIQVFEDEWVYKKDICKMRLKHILGVSDKVIYARKCLASKIDNAQAKEFCLANHIQGYAPSRLSYGLFYDGELVSVMTFGVPSISKGNRDKKDGVYEVSRFCSSKIVVGGASKLFQCFIKSEAPREIFSFCDLRWGNGQVYEKMGMELDKITRPNYYYIVNKKRKHRYNFRKSEISDASNKHLSEAQIMREAGVLRVYDCGHKKFVWGAASV